MFKEMTEDEWIAAYKPIINSIDKNASFNGTMFETYGAEEEFVKSHDPAYVWTYGDGDDGGTHIWDGYHYVNRIGYFITEVPCSENEEIQVTIYSPIYECPTCGSEWEDEAGMLMEDTLGQIDKCAGCATMEEIKEYSNELDTTELI